MEDENLRIIQKGVYVPRWVLEDRDLTIDEKWQLILAFAKKQGGLQHDQKSS